MLKVNRVVKIKLLNDKAKLPSVSEGNVGYDIYSTENIILECNSVTKISTGLSFCSDMGYTILNTDDEDGKTIGVVPFFKIEGRSGMSLKGVFPVGGIIDPSYRGEIGVVLVNLSGKKYEISEGDRIAQLVCYHTLSPLDNSQVIFVTSNDIKQSDRNTNGFGSTGV